MGGESPRVKGSLDPIEARVWLKEIKKAFALVKVSEEEKTKFASYYLKNETTYWWETVKVLEGTDDVAWYRFKELFLEKFFPQFVQDQIELKFRELKQGNMLVAYYERKFPNFNQRKDKFRPGKNFNRKNTCNKGQGNRPATGNQPTHQRPALPDCQVCGKKHGGVRNKLNVVCYRCNQRGNYSREYRSQPAIKPVNKDQPTRNQEGKAPAIGYTCFKCGKPGHIARDCKAPVPVNNTLQIMGALPTMNEPAKAGVYDMFIKDAIMDTDVVAVKKKIGGSEDPQTSMRARFPG
ncbi:uncharacterized protein LOC141691022 [Apium graveolens]|uniref:uncharacterized protein LOC141691022 n=1 Tax=Apium graveolens TaxID=4045 RepID=UPI003D7A1E95